jgi:hypothetical protein
MATFPITYSETSPTTSIPAAKFDLDVSGGNPLVDEFTKAGKDMFNVWQKTRVTEDMADKSANERVVEEDWTVTYNKMRNLGDENEIQKEFEEFKKRNALPKTQNKYLIDEHNKFINNAFPQYQHHTLAEINQNNIRNAKAKFEIGSKQDLEAGRLNRYYQSIELQRKTGMMAPEQADYLTKYAEVDSAIQQANTKILSDKAGDGLTQLNNIDLKGLDEPHLKKIVELKDLAQASSKLISEQAIEAERKVIDDIFIKPQSEFLTSIPSTLNMINTSSIMPVKDKEGQRKKINDRMEAISKGKVDPVTEFDPLAYNDLSIRISRNAASVSNEEISNAVGKGKKGGITVDQKEILFGLKKKYDEGKTEATELHKRYTGSINDLQTAKMFSSNKIENIRLAAETQNILDSWTEKHPDATADDYEKFYNRLIDTSNLSGWYTFFSRKSAESRKAIRTNIETMKKETDVTRTDLSKLSDAELLKRITGD